VLSPEAVAGECAQCHGPGKREPRLEREGEVFRMFDRVRDLRLQLDAAMRVIDAIRDPGRQAQLRQLHREAAAPVDDAVVGAHTFVFTGSARALDDAQQRVAALMQAIAAAPGR
jgi:hypothetical protein